MRRREERLAILLENGAKSQKASRFAWLRNLGSSGLSGQIHEQELGVESSVVSIDDALMTHTEVFDGLGPFCEHFSYLPGASFDRSQSAWRPEDERPSDLSLDALKESIEGSNDSSPNWSVHDAEMISMAAVQRLAMPSPHRTKVGQSRLIAMPGMKTSPVALGPVVIRSLESFRDRPVEVRDGNRFLVSDLQVYSYPKIFRLVYRRRSIDLQFLAEAERLSFLGEAEALKHIPAESAELLGVFLSIPIELISRLRYVSNRNEVVYSLEVMPDRTVTRVHDMAAVRDTASREVHLVPHRTRSRAVTLGPGRNGVK
jgi:hypothetical protein